MAWRTKTLGLTKDQRERGVVYSSCLIVKNRPDLERITHEVLGDDPKRDEHINNLKDVTFFKNMARDMGWDVINEVRR